MYFSFPTFLAITVPFEESADESMQRPVNEAQQSLTVMESDARSFSFALQYATDGNKVIATDEV
jgi:hypothetical protein